MVRFLIQRPIAVFLSFIGILFFSVLAIRNLPVSLLPSIEVPSVVIKVDYPNNPAQIIENSILKSIRSELNSLNNLKSIESTASSETGLIKLQFDYGTRMDLAYIEINEKVDRLQESLPRDMDRPRIIRINTSDIPIIRIQVLPKNDSDLVALSQLSERVLKKRIEQIEGVSIVDINGYREQFISIEPNAAQLSALNISESQIESVLNSANRELGQLSIKDGQYRYFVRMANRLDDIEEIKKLPLSTPNGEVVSLEQLADVKFETEKVLSYHLFGQQEGLVITVHKQNSAKMTELVPLVYEAIEIFKTDYPDVDFELTQDQSTLLNAGIDNLTTSLIYGGIFAFGVLFLFMGNFKMPIIMGITLPVSLVISFLLFRAVGLTINIISLSGLALGLGMLIDNAIIVIDNITRKRKDGLDIIEACISGVNEVMAPLISSVLTTLAVFVPLVFLNGLSGALFYDQAVSVAIILGTSLMVAFILLPLLYRIFFQKSKGQVKEDSLFFRLILKVYKAFYNLIWKFKVISFILLIGLIPLTYFILIGFEKTGLPDIEKTETLLTINWNEPIDAEVNKTRVGDLIDALEVEAITESDIGISQFLLAVEDGRVENAQVYLKFSTREEKVETEQWISNFFLQRHPNASTEIEDAPNAFDQIFKSQGQYFVAKWKNLGQGELMSEDDLSSLQQDVLELTNTPAQGGKGFLFEESLEATIDNEALAFYGIPEGTFKSALANALDGFLVTEIRRFGEVIPIKIQRSKGDLQQQLRDVYVTGRERQQYPLSQFIKVEFIKVEKNITADRTGPYQSLEWESLSDNDIEKLTNELPKVAAKYGLVVDFSGTFFEDQENLRQLIFILVISVALLYFILAAQFESLVQPLIVIFTLPLGILGALLVLQLAGVTLNVMSAIGIIVMLGIMVNDAILKIDTINRLRVVPNQKSSSKEILSVAIAKTGQIRLKPILMTSITTILALLPVIFSSGIGADLQRPLVFSVIGGLTIGTFTALYFVPLAYWFVSSKK
ncbi:efflux RND transporter permease subunit [Roseivirga sp. E12]|uniref:efflux RND transporter permease subunit n=1 Tax=Roseivirga sp. E12 TaxID=2819237 RepID=UPI001ABD1BF5|nr:efflux RND transporter permease subunit [Roseivirga sp. E12]MBO3700396.1 efflux RND transporter permease subunit [Roseivirga sp. E12]